MCVCIADDDDSGVITGTVIGVVLAVIIVLVGIFIVVRRTK